jgi:hypothetical protein
LCELAPPYIDDESKIGIVLEGSLIERSKNDSIETKRNSVVIKPNYAVHENAFGNKGVSLLSINFKKDCSLPESLHNWDWFEDAIVSFSVYKLWYSIKSARNCRE